MPMQLGTEQLHQTERHDAACHDPSFIGPAEQETERGPAALIGVALAVGGLIVTVAWTTLLLYGAWQIIGWIAA